MTDIRVAVEAVLHRQDDSVSIILHDIPMANLEKVLRDVATEVWRTNVIDGIRAQYIGGESLGLSQTRRSFHAHADEEKS
jgi:hypothetical protein